MVMKRGEIVNLMEIVGFETKRSDSSLFTKTIQKKVMEMICDHEDKDKIIRFIKEKMIEFRKSNIMNISTPKAIIMDITKYKVQTHVVKGALFANRYMGKNYDSGDKPMFSYIKKSKKGFPHTEYLCFDEEKEIEGFEVDYDKMIDLQICRKVNPILNAIGCEDIYVNQSTLSQFMV